MQKMAELQLGTVSDYASKSEIGKQVFDQHAPREHVVSYSGIKMLNCSSRYFSWQNV